MLLLTFGPKGLGITWIWTESTVSFSARAHQSILESCILVQHGRFCLLFSPWPPHFLSFALSFAFIIWVHSLKNTAGVQVREEQGLAPLRTTHGRTSSAPGWAFSAATLLASLVFALRPVCQLTPVTWHQANLSPPLTPAARLPQCSLAHQGTLGP